MNTLPKHNPYDFANPVIDQELFVGRAAQLKEVCYYLDHAQQAAQPINLALLGDRASGKTSLLNMIEGEAQHRGFCVVRIDLDEGDARSELVFFFKVFEHLLTAACELGAYGGKEEQTFYTFLDMAYTYVIPNQDDRLFCPFLFPQLYARVMASGNSQAQVSNQAFISDLKKIRAELSRPIILIFDEGNVLAGQGNRIILEKLRNIFQNIPGYMIVLAGTLDLFPVMDDIFSPIIRGFKQITIREFKDKEETKDLIRKPLLNVKLSPDDIFDFETYRDVEEIHEVSGGSPYEIQLLCHVLFRRVQERRAAKMKLDLSALEEVLKELEKAKDINVRPLLNRVRNLTSTQLSALGFLCSSNGLATLDQLWVLEYILNGQDNWTRTKLEESLEYFIEEGILTLKHDIIRFAGDDFDKIYTKYYAREQRIRISIADTPLKVLWLNKINYFIIRRDLFSKFGFGIPEPDVDISSFAEKMGSNCEDDIFAEHPDLAKLLYQLMVEQRNSQSLPIIRLGLTTTWLSIQLLYNMIEPKKIDSADTFLQNSLPLIERAQEVGAILTAQQLMIPVVNIDILASKVERTDNAQMRQRLAEYHTSSMISEYMESAPDEDEDANKLEEKLWSLDEALLHAKLSYRYGDTDPSNVNDRGYVFLAASELDKAKTHFLEAIERSEDSKGRCLAIYNLSITEAQQGNYAEALAQLIECIAQLQELSEEDRTYGCVFIPETYESLLVFEEVWDPNLLEVAIRAREIISDYLDSRA